MTTDKKSIRFFNDYEVRAIWDDENNCWWFSATDIVRAINNEENYTKAANYWRWLKRKLKQEGIELVSATHGFRLCIEEPDESPNISTSCGKFESLPVLNFMWTSPLYNRQIQLRTHVCAIIQA